jgi:hypothetical protein
MISLAEYETELPYSVASQVPRQRNKTADLSTEECDDVLSGQGCRTP